MTRSSRQVMISVRTLPEGIAGQDLVSFFAKFCDRWRSIGWYEGLQLIERDL